MRSCLSSGGSGLAAETSRETDEQAGMWVSWSFPGLVVQTLTMTASRKVIQLTFTSSVGASEEVAKIQLFSSQNDPAPGAGEQSLGTLLSDLATQVPLSTLVCAVAAPRGRVARGSPPGLGWVPPATPCPSSPPDCQLLQGVGSHIVFWVP